MSNKKSDGKYEANKTLMRVLGVSGPSGEDAVIMEFYSHDINTNISIIGTLLSELINELVATELRHEPDKTKEYLELHSNNEVMAYRALYDSLTNIILQDILVGQVGKQYLGAPDIKNRLAKLELKPSKLDGDGITVLSEILDSVKGQSGQLIADLKNKVVN